MASGNTLVGSRSMSLQANRSSSRKHGGPAPREDVGGADVGGRSKGRASCRLTRFSAPDCVGVLAGRS